MSIEVSIEELPINKAVTINSVCKTMKMPKIMSESFSRLQKHLDSFGLGYAYYPFARYENFEWKELSNQGFLKIFIDIFKKKWIFQNGLPLELDIKEDNDIKMSKYKKVKVITCIHKGAYHTVGKTYKELYRWSVENGYEVENISYEFYLNDPRVTSKRDLETKLMIPII